ncbi:dihydroneopterin aldolase [bacterium BMS3Abin04]|nr:dihydroneopterin aldolase [bacterium BMS3Abin04]
MTNIIRIKNAIFYAYHGVMKEEQHMGGKFEADVDLYTDFSEAAEKDDLQYTINYEKVYKFIEEVVNTRKYYLIETLATIIADELLKKYFTVSKIAVRVRKNNVPVGGLIDHVEAEVIKERNE